MLAQTSTHTLDQLSSETTVSMQRFTEYGQIWILLIAGIALLSLLVRGK